MPPEQSKQVCRPLLRRRRNSAIFTSIILFAAARKRAIVLEGLPEMPIRDITLKNVSITSQQGVFITDADNISFENVRVDNKTGNTLNTLRVTNSKLDLVK